MSEVRTLVVGVSSPDTDPVLEAAVALARASNATLHVVYAFPASDVDHDRVREASYVEFMVEAEQYRMESVVQERFPGDEIVCHALQGSASECLLELAREIGADRIVLGAAHHDHGSSARTGITAEAVVRRAGIPVMILGSSSSETVQPVVGPLASGRSAA